MPRPTWDRQTAIDMGNKGRLARAARKIAAATIAQSLPALAQDLSFPDRVKARLRAQIELILSRIEEEAAKPRCDGTRLDRIAAAMERLLDAERIADGRALPGSLRPAAPPSNTRHTAPTISAPRPAVPQPMAPASQPAPVNQAPPAPVPPHVPKPLDI